MAKDWVCDCGGLIVCQMFMECDIQVLYCTICKQVYYKKNGELKLYKTLDELYCGMAK